VDVFLIRHAAAIDETLELRDPMRHLTPEGRAQAVALGDRLRWHDCTPTQIWTSPLVRAVQTAELVAAGLKTNVPVEVVPLVAPGESARALFALVKARRGDASVLLVGNGPGMSGLGALIAGDPNFAALAKAEAARLVDGKVRWRCAWNSEAPTRE